MENSVPAQILFPQPPSLSHLTTMLHIPPGMAKKPPQLIKASITLYKDYDIIFNTFLLMTKMQLNIIVVQTISFGLRPNH